MAFSLKLPVIFLFLTVVLASCTKQDAQQASAGTETVQSNASANIPDPYARFNNSSTIRNIMNSMIDPNADALWESVRYDVTEQGNVEHYPQSDEEWDALFRSAIVMVEGANALMIPGRHVANPGDVTEFPLYELNPEEVDVLIAKDMISWVGFAQGLQAATLQVLDSIRNKDVSGLSANGGLIDEACESCHSVYWYRP